MNNTSKTDKWLVKLDTYTPLGFNVISTKEMMMLNICLHENINSHWECGKDYDGQDHYAVCYVTAKQILTWLDNARQLTEQELSLLIDLDLPEFSLIDIIGDDAFEDNAFEDADVMFAYPSCYCKTGWGAFRFDDCYIEDSISSDSFLKFNKYAKKNQILDIYISGKKIDDIAKGIELAKNEAAKFEAVKFCRTYCARHNGKNMCYHDGETIELSDFKELGEYIGDEFVVDRYLLVPHFIDVPGRGRCVDFLNAPPDLTTYVIYEKNTATGKFVKMPKEKQAEFQEILKERWIKDNKCSWDRLVECEMA